MMFKVKKDQAKENFIAKNAKLNDSINNAIFALDTDDEITTYNNFVEQWNVLADAENCESAKRKYAKIVESKINKALGVGNGLSVEMVNKL